jgi:hypothetical protein
MASGRIRFFWGFLGSAKKLAKPAFSKLNDSSGSLLVRPVRRNPEVTRGRIPVDVSDFVRRLRKALPHDPCFPRLKLFSLLGFYLLRCLGHFLCQPLRLGLSCRFWKFFLFWDWCFPGIVIFLVIVFFCVVCRGC